LGIGLILLGKQKEADLIIETFQIEEFPSELRMLIKTILTMCAYAGSGNVLKIQELQQLVSKKDTHPKVKQLAIIGMSMIALGEDIGSEMLPRSFNHFLQFGDVTVKKAVPLALALLK
jgi:26S proteasome regulatory subunit N1